MHTASVTSAVDQGPRRGQSVSMIAVDHGQVEDIDLSSARFWMAPRTLRDAALATLRREAPVRFFAESTDFSAVRPGAGYWALTRYDDVLAASRRPGLFSSARGIRIFDAPSELARFRVSMLNMDDPRHGRLRGLVQRGFTPRMIRQTEEWIREVAAAIVDDLLERHPGGGCDFVEEVSAPLPLRVICRMMGIPAEDEAAIFRCTNTFVGASDPDYNGGRTPLEAMTRASTEIVEYAQELGRDRRRRRRNDITSELMHAEVDGERLSTEEFGSFVLLLVIAGTETTRNAISHGLEALTDHPAQRAIWWDDFDAVKGSAVEEILRWSTPVRHLRRTTTADVEIRGVRISRGDKVVLWFESANRDEDHWSDPHRFDVRRSPNPHLTFGGGGPHFCLGASLARLEIGMMFEQIWRRLPRLRVVGEPELLRSDFINGIKRMPCAWS
jgi:cytochrome P450